MIEDKFLIIVPKAIDIKKIKSVSKQKSKNEIKEITLFNDLILSII